MSVLLYAIGRALGPSLGAGVGGAPLGVVAEGELAAVVGPLGESPEPEEDRLWEYEAVIERLLGSAQALLPARFGTTFADELAARAMLRERQLDLLAALDRVGGAVEFAVSAGWRRDSEGDADHGLELTGTEYLMGRLQHQRRARDVARRLAPLSALARRDQQRVVPRAELPVRTAYLVDYARTGEFTQLVSQLGQELEDVELVCTGPWPPYSFALGAPA
jgi:hypothetical protein